MLFIYLVRKFSTTLSVVISSRSTKSPTPISSWTAKDIVLCVYPPAVKNQKKSRILSHARVITKCKSRIFFSVYCMVPLPQRTISRAILKDSGFCRVEDISVSRSLIYPHCLVFVDWRRAALDVPGTPP